LRPPCAEIATIAAWMRRIILKAHWHQPIDPALQVVPIDWLGQIKRMVNAFPDKDMVSTEDHACRSAILDRLSNIRIRLDADR
jgi:hypothetical protein